MDRSTHEYSRNDIIEQRCRDEAQWIIDHDHTIRQCAEKFCFSKSTVHRDMHNMKFIDDALYVQVMNIFRRHLHRR
ncbi:MAG: sporulation transcriptional regulator SpoIIID [Cellulosilyticaceae bacterium]